VGEAGHILQAHGPAQLADKPGQVTAVVAVGRGKKKGGVLAAFATGKSLAFGHRHHQRHFLWTDGQGVDPPSPFATPPILAAQAMRTLDGVLFDRKVELHPAFNILRAAIFVTLAHAKRTAKFGSFVTIIILCSFPANIPDEPL
jgi:hypothetical protein